MEKLLSFLCCELDCYLDEIKGDRRGKISKKRKLIVLALVWKNLTTTEIAEILSKDRSSIRTIVKNSSVFDYLEAKELLRKYEIWKNYTLQKKFS